MSILRSIVKRDAAVQQRHRSSADIVRCYLRSEPNPEAIQLPLFFTSIETAHLLRISHRTLEKMRLEKRGPSYFRLGKGSNSRVRYSLDDISDWLARNARGTHTYTRQR